MSDSQYTSARLLSLDQFRGYTMLGMLLVNFLGGYRICPAILKHSHSYCSYADTIMPQFLFAAGFSMRLSLGRRWQRDGRLPWGRVVRRVSGLALVAIVWYSICDFGGIRDRLHGEPLLAVLGTLTKRTWFQTLMHIAVTSLWILPVIVASPVRRMTFAVGSGLLHAGLSWWFNFHWVNTGPAGIDGGPLGFLTWCIPAILGTLACDAVSSRGPGAASRIAAGGVAVMVCGWLLSMPTVLYTVPLEFRDSLKDQKLADDPVVPSDERWQRWSAQVSGRPDSVLLVEPPFVPPPDQTQRKWNYWMMSQRAGSVSYTTFAGGFSLLVYSVCLVLCDSNGWQIGLFRTLGTNSLAAYLLHDVAGWVIGPFSSPESTASSAMLAFVCFTLLVYSGCRFLEWRRWYLRV